MVVVDEGRQVTSYLQMADFVGCDDDAREATGILDDGDAVDLLQTLVNDASSTDVGEPLINPIVRLTLSGYIHIGLGTAKEDGLIQDPSASYYIYFSLNFKPVIVQIRSSIRKKLQRLRGREGQ